MLKAAGLAVSQLVDPAIFRVLILSVLGAGIVLACVWFGIADMLGHVKFQTGWLNWLVRFAVGAGAVFCSFAAFGALAAVIAGFFVNTIADAVERLHYPGLPPPRPQKLSEQIALGLSFLLAMIVLNLLALPVYMLWGANVPVFFLLNGYLLGRAYFELVALRRADRLTVTRMRHEHPLRLLSAGAIIAAISFVPFANLLTPVLATAFMIHIFHSFPEFRRGLPPPPFR